MLCNEHAGTEQDQIIFLYVFHKDRKRIQINILHFHQTGSVRKYKNNNLLKSNSKNIYN